jgi:[ribosomal protein S18]-alanine N-acetyltransferase
MERVGAPAGLSVRPMRPEDIEAVAEIESGTFSTPWKGDTFLGLVDRPSAELWTLQLEGVGVVGYAVLWCILDQGELANIAVRADMRGRGYGAYLLERMLDVARERGVETIYLEVRVSNEPAAALYGGFGFTDVGVRRGYYDKPKEDARVLMLRLGG